MGGMKQAKWNMQDSGGEGKEKKGGDGRDIICKYIIGDFGYRVD